MQNGVGSEWALLAHGRTLAFIVSDLGSSHGVWAENRQQGQEQEEGDQVCGLDCRGLRSCPSCLRLVGRRGRTLSNWLPHLAPEDFLSSWALSTHKQKYRNLCGLKESTNFLMCH